MLKVGDKYEAISIRYTAYEKLSVRNSTLSYKILDLNFQPCNYSSRLKSFAQNSSNLIIQLACDFMQWSLGRTRKKYI